MKAEKKSPENRAKAGRSPGSVATQFKPGVSGNPGGRPKRKPITDVYLRLLDEPCPDDPQGRTYAEVIGENMLRRAVKGLDAIPATKEISDRVEGKARPSEEEREALESPRVIVLDMPPRKSQSHD